MGSELQLLHARGEVNVCEHAVFMRWDGDLTRSNSSRDFMEKYDEHISRGEEEEGRTCS